MPAVGFQAAGRGDWKSDVTGEAGCLEYLTHELAMQGVAEFITPPPPSSLPVQQDPDPDLDLVAKVVSRRDAEVAPSRRVAVAVGHAEGTPPSDSGGGNVEGEQQRSRPRASSGIRQKRQRAVPEDSSPPVRLSQGRKVPIAQLGNTVDLTSDPDLYIDSAGEGKEVLSSQQQLVAKQSLQAATSKPPARPRKARGSSLLQNQQPSDQTGATSGGAPEPSALSADLPVDLPARKPRKKRSDPVVAVVAAEQLPPPPVPDEVVATTAAKVPAVT